MTNRYLQEIRQSHLFPQKKFGQNFLIDEVMLDKIASYASIRESDEVLEVGPGLGFLTRKILAYSPKLLQVIEIDRRLESYLKEKFHDSIKIICDDAMKIDESSLVSDKFKVVSNLPYNVSVPLIMKWISNGEIFDEFYLLVQKEVALRITADSGHKNYGAVSVLVNYLCESQILFEVMPNSFYPEPKVDSAVIRLKIKDNYHSLKPKYLLLKEVTTQLFANRRKMVRKILSKMHNNWQIILSELEISETARAEEIPRDKFIRLAELLHSQQ